MNAPPQLTRLITELTLLKENKCVRATFLPTIWFGSRIAKELGMLAARQKVKSRAPIRRCGGIQKTNTAGPETKLRGKQAVCLNIGPGCSIYTLIEKQIHADNSIKPHNGRNNSMKTITLLLILVSSMGFAQGPVTQDVPKGFHMHDGFYLSLTGGAAFGAITLNGTNGGFNKIELSGAGGQFDFKIGAVISEESNLILSFDVISRAISSPTLTLDGNSVNTTSDVTASDVLYGAGITKYFMPENIFINATVGVGQFSMDLNNTTSKSQSGFGFQLKGGKEWWVSDNWGLGVAAGLSYISASDQTDPSHPGYSGTLSTTKFFVVFNTTFN